MCHQYFDRHHGAQYRLLTPGLVRGSGYGFVQPEGVEAEASEGHDLFCHQVCWPALWERSSTRTVPLHVSPCPHVTASADAWLAHIATVLHSLVCVRDGCAAHSVRALHACN